MKTISPEFALIRVIRVIRGQKSSAWRSRGPSRKNITGISPIHLPSLFSEPLWQMN